MKRSTVDNLIDRAVEFMDGFKFKLPPFAYLTPEDEIRRNMLGWDITDFGHGDFEKEGLLLFTLRNGNQKDPENQKVYAEKIMVVRNGQVTPFHYHVFKQEDIINRGGGDLLIRVYGAHESDRSEKDEPRFSEEDVEIQVDGRHYKVKAGSVIRLKPGESMTNTRFLYHSFWGEGDVLVGEVSQCNDDVSDNRFYKPTGRFPKIEENVAARHLLCNEYPEFD